MILFNQLRTYHVLRNEGKLVQKFNVIWLHLREDIYLHTCSIVMYNADSVMQIVREVKSMQENKNWDVYRMQKCLGSWLLFYFITHISYLTGNCWCTISHILFRACTFPMFLYFSRDTEIPKVTEGSVVSISKVSYESLLNLLNYHARFYHY